MRGAERTRGRRRPEALDRGRRARSRRRVTAGLLLLGMLVPEAAAAGGAGAGDGAVTLRPGAVPRADGPGRRGDPAKGRAKGPAGPASLRAALRTGTRWRESALAARLRHTRRALERPARRGGGAGDPVASFCEECRAGAASCGDEVDGTLTQEDCGEEGLHFDVWRIEVDERGPVRFELSSATFDTVLFLADSQCGPVARNDDCPAGLGTDSCLTAVLEPGVAHVVVTGFAPGDLGPYTLSVSCPRFDGCQDCVVGDAVCGEVVRGDFPEAGCTQPFGERSVDLLRLDHDGGPVRLDLVSQDFDTYLFLFDEDCGFVAQADDCRDLNACLDLDLPGGRYYVGISSFAPGAGGRWSLRTVCPDIGFCAGCRGERIRCGGTVEGDLSAAPCPGGEGEPARTVHALEIARPSVLEVRAEADFPLEIALADRTCDPLSASGSGATPLGTTVAPGRVYVVVSGAPGPGEGAYRLETTCRPIDPCTDCVTGELPCGGEVEDTLSPGDCPLAGGGRVDAWRVELAEPAHLDASLRSDAFAPSLILVDRSCRVVTFGGGFDDPAGELAADLPAGSYVLLATGGEGAYRLSADCGPITLCEDCRVGDVSCNTTVQGRLEARSCTLTALPGGAFLDPWHLEVPREVDLEVELRSQEFDTVLALLDGQCLPAAINDDCQPGRLDSCLLPRLSPGVWTLGVTSFLPGAVGAYELEVSCPGAEGTCSDCIAAEIGGEARARGRLRGGACRTADGRPVQRWDLRLEERAQVRLAAWSSHFAPGVAVRGSGCAPPGEVRPCDGPGQGDCIEAGLDPGRWKVVVTGARPSSRGAYVLEVHGGGGPAGERLPADCDQDGALRVGDALCILDWLFRRARPALPCGGGSAFDRGNLALLDPNGDERVDVSDAVGLLQHLLLGGAPPERGQDCLPLPGCPALCAPGP